MCLRPGPPQPRGRSRRRRRAAPGPGTHDARAQPVTRAPTPRTPPKNRPGTAFVCIATDLETRRTTAYRPPQYHWRTHGTSACHTLNRGGHPDLDLLPFALSSCAGMVGSGGRCRWWRELGALAERALACRIHLRSGRGTGHAPSFRYTMKSSWSLSTCGSTHQAKTHRLTQPLWKKGHWGAACLLVCE